MIAQFERFQIAMTRKQATASSHSGQCIDDVRELLKDRKIIRQLEAIGPDKIREELEEYGAWNDEELANEQDNKERIVWIAAGNIVEGN